MSDPRDTVIAHHPSPSPGPARHPIILDCDPGYDDAVALVLATAFAEVSLVTTIMGNASVECTSRNAAITCRLLNRGVPVAKGAASPLAADPPFFEQENAAVWTELSQHTTHERPADDAAVLLTEKARPGTWIVATGPLTNVALALKHEPALTSRLAGISIMAGGIGVGNATDSAEFNIWADPEAASAVLMSSLRIRMCTLNVTETVLVDHQFIDSIRRIGTSLSDFVAAALSDYIAIYPGPTAGTGVAPLHDPCAVLAVTHPHLFRFTPAQLTVELADPATRGMTVAWTRLPRDVSSANIEIAAEVDADGVRAALFDAIATLATSCSP